MLSMILHGWDLLALSAAVVQCPSCSVLGQVGGCSLLVGGGLLDSIRVRLAAAATLEVLKMLPSCQLRWSVWP